MWFGYNFPVPKKAGRMHWCTCECLRLCIVVHPLTSRLLIRSKFSQRRKEKRKTLSNDVPGESRSEKCLSARWVELRKWFSRCRTIGTWHIWTRTVKFLFCMLNLLPMHDLLNWISAQIFPCEWRNKTGRLKTCKVVWAQQSSRECVEARCYSKVLINNKSKGELWSGCSGRMPSTFQRAKVLSRAILTSPSHTKKRDEILFIKLRTEEELRKPFESLSSGWFMLQHVNFSNVKRISETFPMQVQLESINQKNSFSRWTKRIF